MRILKSFLLLLLLCCATGLRAQNAREAEVKFMKGPQAAFMADYEVPKDMTEQALKDRMSRAGLGKNKTEKGYLVWKGVSLPELSADKVDVYAMVDGKGDKSTVTMLVSKGYDNFVSSKSDAGMAAKVMTLLNGFDAEAKAYRLRMDIAAAEDAVRTQQAEYDKLVKEREELEDDRRKIERRIADKQDAADKRKKQVEEAQKRLDALRGR